MNQKLTELFSYSVGIGAIIGLIRWKIVSQAYLPFILLLWLGFSNEIITTIIISKGYSNAPNNNIYDLIEALSILWLFKKWNLFERNKNLFWYLFFLFAATWGVENFYVSSIKVFNSYFNILYSFIIVLMSIQMINQMILKDRAGLIRNAQFLISVGFIAFFTYKLLIEIFWVYGLNSSHEFRANVYRIMAYINLAVNLIFALAVLWIPRKREYILL